MATCCGDVTGHPARHHVVLSLAVAVLVAGCATASDSGSTAGTTAPGTTDVESSADADATATTPRPTTSTATDTPTSTTAGATGTAATSTTTSTATVLDVPTSIEEVRLDELQVVGSHNSYHLAPEGAVRDGLQAIAPDFARQLDYTHRPLTEQLDVFGIRQLEIDVYADPDGGRFSSRAALPVVGLPAESGIAELDEPGFKVLHIQDVDFGTTCLTLVVCLTEIDAWSTSHPGHVPILVMIELKDETVEEVADDAGLVLPDLGIEWTTPVATTARVLADLEDEVRSVFDRTRMITPDDVRGAHATLPEAIAQGGWPTLGESRGKVMVALLLDDDAADLYRSGSPSLEGRLFFTLARPGAADAAIVGFDDPVADADAIAAAVADGYLVRTRSDDDDTLDGDVSRRDIALRSGAHFVSTDLYVDVGRGFVVRLPGEVVVRCNPVTRTSRCVDADLAE